LSDPDAVFDAPNSKFTAPATGVYLFLLTIEAWQSTAGNKLGIQLYKNGSYNTGFDLKNTGVTNDWSTYLCVYPIALNSADYIEVYARHVTSGKTSYIYTTRIAGWRMS
jgi:hypothetical protein